MAEKQDMPMNGFKIASDAPYVYAEAADGSQVKISKEDLASLINRIIGGVFPKMFSNASKGNTKGFVIKTTISAKRQYLAIRLQCSIGFNQNTISNENFSINLKYWDYSIVSCALSKEVYSVVLCNYVVCYVDDDNTFSFYLNSVYPNQSGGYQILYVISNVSGYVNCIVSSKEVDSEYVMGSHVKEMKITIS